MSRRARPRDPVRSTAALAAGRAAASLSQALGRGSGTMIGGRLALRLDPNVLATVAGERRPVLVTGTNGKSTVTALVAAALSAGDPVATNSTGANMPDGIVTALTADRTSPLAVLEVDEVYLSSVVDATAPRVVIALNAFREYTRGVSLAATLGHWRAAAARLPEDCIVLTLACGKFRFFDKDLGTIGGLPRLMDVGQCNDAYSAIQIAVALAGAFNVGVNDLPLSIICSWYEQKAVAILLTLFHLGIKNIRLGPSLPAFVTPNVLDVLVKNFNIMPISTPDEDLKAILG